MNRMNKHESAERSEQFRVETDLLGDVEIPSTAYWGIRTARANLAVSGLAIHSKLTDAMVILKRCTLDLSPATGGKSRDIKEALLTSCDEILEGKLQANFVADPYHCDAGEAINTNVNEVIANRAEELLGGSLGSYERINPDVDVDLRHSPVQIELRNAAKIGLLLGLKDLEPEILDIERWFRRKSLECEQIIHSSDNGNNGSAWKSLGPQLNACGAVIERCHRRLLESVAGLQEMTLSNVGNAAEKELIDAINKTAGITLHANEEKSTYCNSMSEFLQFSSALKELAVELSTVSRNLYSSCSKFGPSLKRMTDLLALAACQVMANDHAVSQCCQVTEVPVAIPFVANSLLQSLDLLRSALRHFNSRCITELQS
jgi:aspartate ammonia-lyase